MPRYQVHEAGIRHAEKLIRDGACDTETKWSEAAASTSEENEFMDDDGYRAWARWHLAEDLDASEGTKARFRFPYGDFEKVNRAALVHAKQRAVQNGHDDIADAADKLLERVDRRSEG